MSRSSVDRAFLAGAIWGPAAFVAAWVVAGMLLPGYSATASPISELAAVGAATQPLMTAGIAAYVIGVGMAAWPMRDIVGRWSATAAGASAVASAGVMVAPLGVGPAIDALHAAFAATAYAATAAIGLLAAPHLFHRRGRIVGAAPLVVGVVSAMSLVLSLVTPAEGLFQRIGLTTTDAWLMAVGLAGTLRRGS